MNIVSVVELKVPIRRNAQFFIYRVILIMSIIYAMSWFTFLLDIFDYSGRLNINVTLTLALVSFAIIFYI